MTETQNTQAEQVDNRCRFCEQPVIWQPTAGDTPGGWFHTTTLDILRCPEGMPAGWVAPV